MEFVGWGQTTLLPTSTMSLKTASEKESDQTIDDFNTPEDKALVRKIDLRCVCLFLLASFDLALTPFFQDSYPS
jgi:hypothetical protein